MNKYFYGEMGQKILLYFLAFCFFVAILPTVAFKGDISFWINWTRRIQEHGIGNLYNLNSNYHPFFLYCLYIFQRIMGNMQEVVAHINYVKVFPLIFDFIGALSVFLILKERKNAIIYPFFLLFNIAYMYNTMIWGQMDSIHTAFILLSIICSLKEKAILASLFFVLAINTKLQAIIFLPIIGLILLPVFFRSYQTFLKCILVTLLSQVIILIPFMLAGTVGKFWAVVLGADGHHPYISLKAFNIWYYFVEGKLDLVKDTPVFALGLSYKTWGRILFFTVSLGVLFPLIKTSFITIKNRINNLNQNQRQELVFLSAGLITIVFFYFNTQMHERYSHPAILMFFFYAIVSKKYLLYILCSLAYLLNMESVLKAFDFDNYRTLIFQPVFVASIYLIIIILGIRSCYQITRQKE